MEGRLSWLRDTSSDLISLKLLGFATSVCFVIRLTSSVVSERPRMVSRPCPHVDASVTRNVSTLMSFTTAVAGAPWQN